MGFTDELWKSIDPIYAAILRHPFLRGLTDGSLPRESFKFYAVQDALYLREFARALSLAGARAPQDDWIIMFNEHAAGALKVLLCPIAPGPRPAQHRAPSPTRRRPAARALRLALAPRARLWGRRRAIRTRRGRTATPPG